MLSPMQEAIPGHREDPQETKEAWTPVPELLKAMLTRDQEIDGDNRKSQWLCQVTMRNRD